MNKYCSRTIRYQRYVRASWRSFNDIIVEKRQNVAIISINRPHRKNAIDDHAASELREAFTQFDADDSLSVAVLTGVDNTFCAGYDLKSLSASDLNKMEFNDNGPMGPTRMILSKPVIAAIEGYCVAGNLFLPMLSTAD